MNLIKQFRNSLIVFGLLLIFIPIFCYANMAVGAMAGSSPIVFLLCISFAVWAVESLVIKNILYGTPGEALLASFLINLSSTILGYLAFIFLSSRLVKPGLAGLVSLFVGTVIVEGILLYFFYPKNRLEKILAATFLMNTFSYTLLLFFAFIGAIPFWGTFLVFVMIFYLSWRLFGLFPSVKELPDGNKLSAQLILSAKYLTSVLLIVLLVFALRFDSKSDTRHIASDVRIKATMIQITDVAQMHYMNGNNSFVDICDQITHRINVIAVTDLALLQKEILINNGNNNELCYSTPTAYCVKAKLKTYPAQSLCVDSTGATLMATSSTASFCDADTASGLTCAIDD